MIKFPEKKNVYEIKKYFKSYKLSNIFSSKLFTKDSFKPNLVDLYRIHRFIILNKRICALEYGTGWSTMIMSHALKINKLKLNDDKFFVFTDGLSESLDNKGNEIGIEGSIKVIEDNYTNDRKKHLTSITKKVIETSRSKKLSDDLTLIAIG